MAAMEKAQAALPPITIAGNEQLGHFIGGVLDVLVAFGCALANAGVLEREDIAKEMASVIDQQIQRDGGTRPPTQYPAQAIKAFFSAPVFSGKPN